MHRQNAESTTGALEVAHRQILEPSELTEGALEQMIGGMLSGVDAADIYLQHARSESWALEDGKVKDGSYSVSRGAGIRAISGEKTGFAYSDAITAPALLQTASAARTIARHGADGTLPVTTKFVTNQCYGSEDPLSSMNGTEQVEYLLRIDRDLRAMDSRIREVNLSLSGLHEVILVLSDEGRLAADVRPLVRMNVSVIAQSGKRIESGAAGGGGRFDYQWFLSQDRGLEFGREAVRKALLNLEAQPAPAGMMPVVLGPGWPGVLLHEAVGHGLEGDFNRKQMSEYSGRIGEQVASPLCTIVDNGAMHQRRGSLNIDDEGTSTGCTVLIENGVLKGYIQDKLNARLMNQQPTGNGRRESYAHTVMPRMTNTYMLPGQSDPQDIISSVEKGLYAVDFGGGEVDITSGEFVFSATEAYLIEKGRITAPVKGATLIGKGPEVMSRISMVGNDLKLDEGSGTCGKEGQRVPVGVGQPTLKIDTLTIGGTGT